MVIITVICPSLQSKADHYSHDLLLVLAAVLEWPGHFAGRVLCPSPRREPEATECTWYFNSIFNPIPLLIHPLVLELQVLHVVPRDSWCPEVMRFSDQICNETIAFSGWHFFYFTRKLILSVNNLGVPSLASARILLNCSSSSSSSGGRNDYHLRVGFAADQR